MWKVQSLGGLYDRVKFFLEISSVRDLATPSGRLVLLSRVDRRFSTTLQGFRGLNFKIYPNVILE